MYLEEKSESEKLLIQYLGRCQLEDIGDSWNLGVQVLGFCVVICFYYFLN